MNYKFKVLNGKYDISIPNDATFHSETKIKINKAELKLLINESDNQEIKSFFVDNTLYKINLEKDEKGYPKGIFVNDWYFPASLLKIDKLFYYHEKEVESLKAGIARSFIPGNIKKIFFSINDEIKENEIVLIHEAMKMENEIRSPKSGIITKINVTEGENIPANHILFEVE
jgi:biotin carboxyl carrier protein